jgi:hypothetical protein
MQVNTKLITITPPSPEMQEHISTWKVCVHPEDPKLPKQWLHWAMKAGLKPTGGGRGLRSGFYLQGKNRNWRVTCHGDFEVSCPLEHFDRWANSSGGYSDFFPTNEKEFKQLVKQMHAASVDAE